MATKKEIAKLVRGLEGGYMTQCSKWTEAQWRQVYHRWFEVLGPVPLPLLEAASKYCALTEKWFPQPSQIVDAMVILRGMAEGQPSPEKAWEEARSLVTQRWFEDEQRGKTVYRLMRPEDCSHPFVWETITAITADRLKQGVNESHDYAQFKAHYTGLCRRQQQLDVVTALLTEMQGVPRLTSKAQPAIAAETGRF